MWFLLALLSGFCAAVLAIIVKMHLKHFNPFFITLIFSIITAIILLIAEAFTKKISCSSISNITLHEWILLGVAGGINGLAFTAYLAALKSGKTCGVVAIDRLGILFVVILSVFFLQESFTYKTIIGALMMIGGTALLSL